MTGLGRLAGYAAVTVRLPALLGLVLWFALAGGPAFAEGIAVPSYAEHGTWLLACDNTRRCEARGLGVTGRAALQIIRDAGEAPAILTLAAANLPLPPVVRLAGKRLVLKPPAWETHVARGVTFSTTEAPHAVRALLAAARGAPRLALSGGHVIPLAGLGQVLREMDAVQGRAGTPSPRADARGSLPAPRAPRPPVRPRWRRPAELPQDEAAALIASVRRQAAGALRGSGCAHAPTLEHDEAHALDARHALVTLACPYDAYQGETFTYIVPRAGGAPVPFAPRVPVLGTLREPLGDTAFDPATGVLTSRKRGAGLANCGTRAAWIWSAGAFHLISLTYQAACGGPFADDWPALFRTAPRGE